MNIAPLSSSATNGGYRDSARRPDYQALRDQFVSKVPEGGRSRVAAAHSRYFEELDRSPGRLGGGGRCYGCASQMTQALVVDRILDATLTLTDEDRAIVLAIAYVESGLNPDAANTRSSASGVFQFVDATGVSLGLRGSGRWSVDAQIEAMRGALHEYLPKVRGLRGVERAIALYALHHDGPQLNAGGKRIAQARIVPLLGAAREIAVAHREMVEARI